MAVEHLRIVQRACTEPEPTSKGSMVSPPASPVLNAGLSFRPQGLVSLLKGRVWTRSEVHSFLFSVALASHRIELPAYTPFLYAPASFAFSFSTFNSSARHAVFKARSSLPQMPHRLGTGTLSAHSDRIRPMPGAGHQFLRLDP